MALSCLTRSTSSFSPSGTKSNSPKSSETPHLPKQRKPAFLRQSSRYLPSLHCWQGLSPRAAQPPPPPSWVRSPPWEPVLLPRRSRNGRHVIYRPPASRKVYGTALWPLTSFVDLNSAFDTVSREGLWKIMSKFGCPTNSSPSFASSMRACKPEFLIEWAVRILPSLQRFQARLCPCPDTIQLDVLCYADRCRLLKFSPTSAARSHFLLTSMSGSATEFPKPAGRLGGSGRQFGKGEEFTLPPNSKFTEQ